MTGFLINRFFGKRVDLLDHWYCLIPDFGCSTDAFYGSIEEELTRRGIPGLEVTRVEHAEGSALSMRREYLQLRRERLLFEVCSAPFGDSWFFSCRFTQYPINLRFWHLAACGGLLFLLWMSFAHFFAGWWLTALITGTILSAVYLLKVVSLEKGIDLDEKLLRIPVLGPVYETFFRRNTYYREDTRIMYVDLMDTIVKAKIREVAGEQHFGKGNEGAASFKRSDLVEGGSLQGLFRQIGKLCTGLLKG